ncbi:dTDP-4-amino-4,6-dideoxygalactose transaminase [Intrasporangium oryzae]|nr:dTDP-4-amino-4,6-dideoxygalactose transaminase [Intrasporangium oryzae]
MFSQPFRAGNEQAYVEEALSSAIWHGDGPFTERATRWLVERTGARDALLTTSCTHALELAGMLLELAPGDEVICPSFTFSSTATAIAIRGAVPVFVDVDPTTMNIDPVSAAAAITDRTKAIYIVHYGGVACDLPALQAVADQHGLAIVEDNAHSLGAYFNGQHLGTFGTFGTQSWHDTKNVTSGEGGAILINDERFAERAEILREKGTNRSRFLRGQVDKYTWVDQGSSYLPSDLLAALLLAQFERFDDIQTRRHAVWNGYDKQLGAWASDNGVELMTVPEGCEHPAHLYFLMMPTHEDQTGLISHLKEQDIVATFHYQPLDSSPAGRKLGRTPNPCPVTADRSMRLVRLPLHAGMTDADTDRVIGAITEYRAG